MSDASGLWQLALDPAGAAGLYWAINRYYRNTDKSHAFERETTVDAEPITRPDHKVSEVEGTRKMRIAGDNVRAYRSG
ncbi:hypothetical protein [Arenimonas donghaensis]|uniref:Uncharacterized protein n=1 Tax=Arenimonas donghaensis DSM 18148 = HO3-R19 TaxID=1121014 RepID=A0A087MLE8_9GAMM|nr:hypothetical protein [Arenimonas donghaensis]KFL37701.1 hypothetical protein N788_00600 [Arenimonas donghaensis DSM 18148 = HO3-R19]